MLFAASRIAMQSPRELRRWKPVRGFHLRKHSMTFEQPSACGNGSSELSSDYSAAGQGGRAA